MVAEILPVAGAYQVVMDRPAGDVLGSGFSLLLGHPVLSWLGIPLCSPPPSFRHTKKPHSFALSPSMPPTPASLEQVLRGPTDPPQIHGRQLPVGESGGR